MYLGRNPAVGTQKMLDSIESQFNGVLTTFDLRYGGVPTYPTLSESLIVSLGGVLQEPGEAYYVSSDKIVFSEAPNTGTECWILLYSQYGASTSSTPGLAIQATGEPMGFENRTHSTISFNNGTRTFSIAPNTSGGYSSYVVWTKGTKRTYSVSQSVQVGTTTGLYYIYFDAFGVLQYKTTYFTWDTETPVAYVYWNSATSSAPFVADERHGIVLDWQTHEYLHRTRGAVIAEGFSISAYTTTGNGSADAHAQFDLGNGTFFDEDLEVNITHSASPTVGTFTQILQGGAEIPVFYMSGSSGAWVRDSANKYACKQSATTLQYNSLSGSTWSTTPADNNRYVVSWVVATNDITAPVICILGQEQYTAIGAAEAVKFGNLTLTNFPIVEFRPLWKVIFQTSTGFTNTPNALIANVLDLRQLSETGEAGTVVSDHGLLSGLTDDDHAQYLHVSNTRTGVTAEFNTTGKITTTSNIGIGIVNPSYNLQVGPGNFANIAGQAGVAISADSEIFGTYGTGGDLVLRAQRPTDGGGGSVVLGGSARGDFKINSVLIRTANTDRVFVNSSGNVGIGTTNPGYTLDVQGSQNVTTQISLWGRTIGQPQTLIEPGRIYATAAGLGPGNLLLQPTGGNIGIGTDSPSERLHVHAPGTDLAAIRLSGTATLQIPYRLMQGITGVSNAGFSIYDITAASTRFAIDSAGNIGIGTGNPLSFSGQTHLSVNYSGDGTQVSGYNLLVNGTRYASFISYPGNSEALRITAHSNSLPMVFQTNDQTRMLITAAGNVGIGITNPAVKLDVAGEISASSVVRTNSNRLVLRDDSIENHATDSDTASVVVNYFGYGSGTTRFRDFQLYNGKAGLILKAVGSTGNVGVGTTNPTTKLDVVGAIRAEKYQGVNSLVLNSYQTVNPSSNVFLYSQPNDRDSWIYLDSADTSSNWGIYHRQIDTEVLELPRNSIGFVGGGNNTLKAYISLQSGNAYFSGNVGIGTTNPGTPLDVRGTDSLIRASETGSGSAWRARIISHNPDAAVNRAAFLGVYGTSAGVFAHNAALDAWAPLFVNTTNGSSDGGTVVLAGSGSVGIGTNNPLAKLHVNATGRAATIGGAPGGNPAGTVATQTSYLELVAGSGGSTNSSAVVFHNPGVSTAALEYINASDNIGYFNFKSDDATWNVGIGTTAPSYKLEVSGRSNFNDNMKITPTSEAWAEGLQFYMPNTSTWGGLRWVRNRSNFHGSWYQGWTGLDSSNDMVFGHNASGTQVDNILRLYGSASGSARIGRDLYITGLTGGNYGNRLVVGNTDTSYTLQDGNLRPTIQATGWYPVLSLNNTVTSNTSHGPTLQFTCNGVGHQFVIGTTGNGSRMDIGFSSAGDWNPHNGISNHQGTTAMSFTTSGNIGIGTLNPETKLVVQSGNLRVGGGGYSRNIYGYKQANASAFDMFYITGLSGHSYIQVILHHFHSGGGMHGSYRRFALSLNSYTAYVLVDNQETNAGGGLGFSFSRTSTSDLKITWNGTTEFSTDFFLYCEIKGSNNFSVSNIGMDSFSA